MQDIFTKILGKQVTLNSKDHEKAHITKLNLPSLVPDLAVWNQARPLFTFGFYIILDQKCMSYMVFSS